MNHNTTTNPITRNRGPVIAGVIILMVIVLIIAGLLIWSHRVTPDQQAGSGPNMDDRRTTLLDSSLAIGHEVVGTHPWDEEVWTQGLDVDPLDPNRLLVSEGSGPSGQEASSIFFQNRRTGMQVSRQELPCYASDRSTPELPTTGQHCIFAEGAAFSMLGSSVWQLTWTDAVAYQREPGDLSVRGTAVYGSSDDVDEQALLGDAVTEKQEPAGATQQGWGICESTDSLLVVSDGTDKLRVREAAEFGSGAAVPVTDPAGNPVRGINELACGVYGGEGGVWANLWPGNQLAFIALLPEGDQGGMRGEVRAYVNLSALRWAQSPDADVANGVAVVPGTGESPTGEQSRPLRLYVTGKHWSKLYEIEVAPAEAGTGADVDGDTSVGV